MKLLVSIALLTCLLSLAAVSVAGEGMTFEITVPEEVKPKGQDAYICTTLQLPNKPYKLVGVEPLGEQKVVHHILLFGGCKPHSVHHIAVSAARPSTTT